ncbi:MAG: hypothetical protein IIV10_03760 [Alistipes sp.]|nr:hypothetical protein [Alistipes sp.]
MKQQIDNLIRNLLGEEHDIYLPQVGTLMVRRRPATMPSSKMVMAPYREVTFTGEQRGESLVEIIISMTDVTSERAEAIYEQWLQQVRRDDEVRIDGVGVVRQRQFEAEKSFVAYLNPQPRKSVVLRPRTNYLFYLLASLCILFAVGVAGYILYSEQLFAERMEKPALLATSASVHPAEMNVPQPAENNAAAQETAVEPVAVEKPVGEPVQEVVVEKPQILAMKTGYSYAVWGVYSELKNAEYYVGLVAERYIDLTPAIYTYNNRYMVAVFERKSRGECAELVDRLKELSSAFRDMWVYTKR